LKNKNKMNDRINKNITEYKKTSFLSSFFYHHLLSVQYLFCNLTHNFDTYQSNTGKLPNILN
jgi:hypothetical protein